MVEVDEDDGKNTRTPHGIASRLTLFSRFGSQRLSPVRRPPKKWSQESRPQKKWPQEIDLDRMER